MENEDTGYKIPDELKIECWKFLVTGQWSLEFA